VKVAIVPTLVILLYFEEPGRRSYAFLRSTKHVKRSLPYSQDFSKICFRVKIWSVGRKEGKALIYLSRYLDQETAK